MLISLRANAAALIVVSFLLLTPCAAAWTLEAGVFIEDAESLTLIANPIEVTSEAQFIGETFMIDSFGWDFDAPSAWQWNLTNWNPPFNVTYEGNVTTNGSALFNGFQGYYQVSGLYGYPTFTVSGPTFSFNILPGAQTFSITPVSITINGITLLISSEWNAPQDTLFTVVTLLDASGNPLTGATINNTILAPDGSIFSSVTMTASIIPGVYNSNVTFTGSEPDGTYTSTATYGGTVNANAVIKQPGGLNGMLETAIDIYLPLLIWGGILAFCLWLNAWAPAIGVLMGFLNHYVLPTPLMSMTASVMLIMVLFIIHSLVVNGFIPRPFAKRGN